MLLNFIIFTYYVEYFKLIKHSIKEYYAAKSFLLNAFVWREFLVNVAIVAIILN